MMKSIVIVALLGAASTQEIFDEEDDVQEDLDISVSRYNQRRIERKMRDVQLAWGEYTGAAAYGWREWTKTHPKELAWLKSKGSKYQKLFFKFMQSKEFQAQMEFEKNGWKQDKLALKVVKQGWDLAMDVAGGRGWFGRGYRSYKRGMFDNREDQFSTRPRETPGNRIDRYTQEKNSYDGIHIDNEDIKNVAQDARHIVRDLNRLYDPNYPFMKRAIALDAASRWSDPMQNILKNLSDDLDIHSWKEFAMKAGKVIKKMRSDAKDCPFTQRLKKTIDRLLREVMKDVVIRDLPRGDREKWVNYVINDIYNMMNGAKRGTDPVPKLKTRFRGFLKAIITNHVKWMMRVDKIQQKLRADSKDHRHSHVKPAVTRPTMPSFDLPTSGARVCDPKTGKCTSTKPGMEDEEFEDFEDLE